MSDTERLLARARRRGDLPISPFLLRAGGLCSALGCLPWLVRSTWANASGTLREVLTSLPTAGAGAAHAQIQVDPWALVWSVLMGVLPITAAVAAAVLCLGLMQTRGFVAWRPASQRRTSNQDRAILEAGHLLGALLLLGVSIAAVAAHLGCWLEPTGPLEDSLLPGRFDAVLNRVAWLSAGTALALGVLDSWFVRRLWVKRNELTPAEMLRERRQQEMAPELRSAQRRAYYELLDARPKKRP